MKPTPVHPEYALFLAAKNAVDDEWLFSIHWGRSRDWKLDALDSCEYRADSCEYRADESRLRELNAVISKVRIAINEEVPND